MYPSAHAPISVSYTHLDVYKRQEDTAAPADDGGAPDVPPSAPLFEESRQDRAHTLQASEQGSAPPGQDRSSPSARKIERSEISKLPRRFWFLANNSFLLHGYHNYNHLLLVEEDGHVWLGVPGIYDVREARAADLFGFPQFTRSYAPMLGLSEDERNDGAAVSYTHLDVYKRQLLFHQHRLLPTDKRTFPIPGHRLCLSLIHIFCRNNRNGN